MKGTRILIIGGGFISAVAALLFANRGAKVFVVSATPAPDIKASHDDPWVWALNARAVGVLEEAGVSVEGCFFDRMSIFHGAASHLWQFDAGDVHQAHLGHMVPVSPLQYEANRCARQHARIRFLDQTQIMGREMIEHQWHYTLSSGESLVADLCLASDGPNGLAHTWLPSGQSLIDYQQISGIARVRCEHALDACAYQCFDQGVIAALLPCYGPHGASLVWTIDATSHPPYQALDEQALNDQLSVVFAPTDLGQIVLESPIKWLPLKGHRCKEVAGSGVVLIGRSAQSVHPFFGQATSLSLIELAALIEAVEHYQKYEVAVGDDLVLSRYQRWYVGEHQIAIWVMNRFWQLMTQTTASSSMVGLLSHLSKQGLFKQWAMSWAMGARLSD